MSPTLWTRLGLLTLRKRIKYLLCRLRSKVLVEIVSHHQHRRVTACALALDLDDSELAVLGRIAGLDAAKVLADCVENVRGAA